MRGLLLIAASAAALLPIPARAQAQPPTPPPKQESPAIRRTADLVNVVFSVFNRRQKFVTTLEKGNFSVFEDNRQQEIQFFDRATDLPLRIGLVLDTSNSIRDRLKFEQEAAIDFVHNVIRRRKDLAFLMTFDAEPAIVQDYTDDAAKLSEMVMKQRAGGGTALYDAIYYACHERLLNAPPAPGPNPDVRRVLVIISDGEDTFPGGRSLVDAIDMAQRAEVAIYAISTSTEWVSLSGSKPQKFQMTDGDKVLKRFAEETGGRAFFPYRVDDLAASFQDIGDELRTQYSVGYVPTNRAADGRFRAIRIEVDQKGLNVRARKGYFAPRAVPPRATGTGNSPGQ